MEKEIEVRILEIEQEQIEKKLQSLGAIKKGEFFQRRYVYDLKPTTLGKWLRLRTNGIKTTLTYKDVTNKKIDGTKEIEIEVSDFSKTHLLLEKIGYIPRNYQENKRVTYYLEDVEIDLDFWPLLPCYIEIEGKSIEKVEETVAKLGYTINETTTMDVNQIYQKYGYDLESIKILKFEEK